MVRRRGDGVTWVTPTVKLLLKPKHLTLTFPVAWTSAGARGFRLPNAMFCVLITEQYPQLVIYADTARFAACPLPTAARRRTAIMDALNSAIGNPIMENAGVVRTRRRTLTGRLRVCQRIIATGLRLTELCRCTYREARHYKYSPQSYLLSGQQPRTQYLFRCL